MINPNTIRVPNEMILVTASIPAITELLYDADLIFTRVIARLANN